METGGLVLCLLTAISTSAEDRRRSAPTRGSETYIMTEDWAKCALKSIYVPYGVPASEKKMVRASETPTRSITITCDHCPLGNSHFTVR